MSIPYIDDEMYPWKGSIEQLLNYWQPGFGDGISSFGVARARLNDVADDYGLPPIEEGSAAVARDRINALIDGSGIPEGARMFLDFKTGRYYEGSPTVSRAGEVLMLGPDGYQAFPANTLARIDGIGAQVVPARTNKCTNYNANPVDLTGFVKGGDAAATLTIVDDAAALASVGLSGICTSGKVFKLDNSAGTASALAFIGGQVGNVNPHVMSVFARAVFASGFGARLLASGGSGASSYFPNGQGYARYSQAFTPTASTVQMAVEVGAGAVVYFILYQLEEGSYASPPIITSGAAVSRPGDILSASVPDGGRAFAFEFDLLEPSAGESQRRIVSFGSSAGNEIRVLLGAAGAAVLSSAVAGVSGGQTNTVSMPGGIKRGYAVFSSGSTALGFVGGSETVASTPVALPLISASSFLGSPFNTSNNSFGIMRKFAERPVTDFATPADAFAWAKSIAQGWA